MRQVEIDWRTENPDPSTIPKWPDALLDWLCDDARFAGAILTRTDTLGRLAARVDHAPVQWPFILADPASVRLGWQRFREAALRGHELVIATHASVDEIRDFLLTQRHQQVDEPPDLRGQAQGIALAALFGSPTLCTFDHDAEPVYILNMINSTSGRPSSIVSRATLG